MFEFVDQSFQKFMTGLLVHLRKASKFIIVQVYILIMMLEVPTYPSPSKTWRALQQQIRGGYRFAELRNRYLREPEPKSRNLRWFIVSQQSHPKLGIVWMQGKIPQLWHISDFVVLAQLIFKRQNRCHFEKSSKEIKGGKKEMIAGWTRTKGTEFFF